MVWSPVKQKFSGEGEGWYMEENFVPSRAIGQALREY